MAARLPVLITDDAKAPEKQITGGDEKDEDEILPLVEAEDEDWEGPQQRDAASLKYCSKGAALLKSTQIGCLPRLVSVPIGDLQKGEWDGSAKNSYELLGVPISITASYDISCQWRLRDGVSPIACIAANTPDIVRDARTRQAGRALV
ncbi:hypothetical protein B0H13DRAFT_2333288 [Mycena leptocephala]|nr:hypothetical protein B0H13DRAFT_2333288 [Mycena leptocephala]